jgi:hypothetical protein
LPCLRLASQGSGTRIAAQGLEEDRIDRSNVYVTNAVKHFTWERAGRGTRRIHKKPNDAEIRACRALSGVAHRQAWRGTTTREAGRDTLDVPQQPIQQQEDQHRRETAPTELLRAPACAERGEESIH